MSNLQPLFISGEDELVTAAVWEKMVQAITDNFMEADGFVIVSKIDNLLYTGAALSFLLQNFQKTVILTSSQISGTSFVDKKAVIEELRNKQGGLGLRANIINALQIADRPLPSPAIMFGQRLISAIKALPDQQNQLNLLASADGNYWGKVDFGVNLKSGLYFSPHQPDIYKKIKADIFILEDWPGTPWMLTKDNLVKYHGLFIKASPYQPLEKTKQGQIAKWKLPTVIYNRQSVRPIKGAVAISGCTPYVALTKTMWALANAGELADFTSIMQRNLIGEFNN